MRRKHKWIIMMFAAWLFVCLFSVLVLRKHMSLFPRMFGFSRIFGNSPLHWAAEDGRTGAIEKLLAKGEDVDRRNSDGETPLHCAAFHGQKKAVSLLIAKGADVNAKDYYDSTPLHKAAFDGQVDIVELLLDAGADVNARTKKGQTPLDSAATSRENSPIFDVFLAKRLDACMERLHQHEGEGYYPKRIGRKTSISIGSLFPISGVFVCFVAYTWFIVVAFKEDILWGFGCLLMPLVAPVFLMLHWDECKKPVLASAIGAVICLLGSFLGPALDLL